MWSLVSVGTGAVANVTNTLPMSGLAPSGSGGILLMPVACRLDPTSFDTPNGWTKILDGVSRMYLFARESDGSSDDTPTLTYGGSPQTVHAAITRWTGGNTNFANLLHGSPQTDTAIGVTYIPLAGITPTIDNCLILRLGMQVNDTGPAASYPNTLLLEQNINVANDMWVAHVYEIQSAAAAVSAGQINNTTAQSIDSYSVSIALTAASDSVPWVDGPGVQTRHSMVSG